MGGAVKRLRGTSNPEPPREIVHLDLDHRIEAGTEGPSATLWITPSAEIVAAAWELLAMAQAPATPEAATNG